MLNADEELVAQRLNHFDADLSRNEKLASEIKVAAEERLEASGLNHFRVEARVKSRASFEAKVRKDPLREIEDVVGMRVLVFFRSDIPWVEKTVTKMLKLDEGSYVDKSELHDDQTFGYRSVQFVGRVKRAGWDSEPDVFDSSSAAQKVEVQIRTLLEHAWAEVDHHIIYKPRDAKPSPSVRRRLALTAALLEQGDENLDQVRDQIEMPTLGDLTLARGVELTEWVHERFTQTSRESIALDTVVGSALGLPILHAQKATREVANAAQFAGLNTYAELTDAINEYGPLGLRLAIACVDASRPIFYIDYRHVESPRAFRGVGLYWTSLAIALGVRRLQPAQNIVAVPEGRLREFQSVATYLVANPDVSPLTARDQYRPQAAPAGSVDLKDFQPISLPAPTGDG